MRVLRLKEVINITGLSRSTIYELIAQNQFPKQLPLGARAVGWVEEEINNWITQQIAARDH